jgi:hypothetical protein
MLGGKQEAIMTLEEVVLKALEGGEGNPKQITLRLVDRVRTMLNRLADDGKIERYGDEGRGIEKTYRLSARPRPIVRLTARLP